MKKIIEGSLESLDQMISFIEDLDEHAYLYIAAPWFMSSIGQHLRHSMDLFLALQTFQEGFIDYDVRRRGCDLEKSRNVGLSELKSVRAWLINLTESCLTKTIEVKTEVSLSTQNSVALDSSLARELGFTSSHLVHHLALMAVIAKMAGKKIDDSYGLAPATATYMRNEAEQLLEA